MQETWSDSQPDNQDQRSSSWPQMCLELYAAKNWIPIVRKLILNFELREKIRGINYLVHIKNMFWLLSIHPWPCPYKKFGSCKLFGAVGLLLYKLIVWCHLKFVRLCIYNFLGIVSPSPPTLCCQIGKNCAIYENCHNLVQINAN